MERLTLAPMLALADFTFHVLHLAIIFANLFGWIFPATRHLHRILILTTAFCWLAVGWAVGAIGYCPLTDWHWQIKRLRGEEILPHSYIDYLLQTIGLHFNPMLIDIGVGVVFALTLLVTIGIWVAENRKAHRQ